MSKKETVSSNEGKIQKNSQEETVAEIMPEVKNTSKMKGMIQSLEMMAMQRSSRDNLDISKFTDAQRDKLLDIMSKNEDNAFKFHNKRLEVTEKLNTKIIESEIDSSIIIGESVIQSDKRITDSLLGQNSKIISDKVTYPKGRSFVIGENSIVKL